MGIITPAAQKKIDAASERAIAKAASFRPGTCQPVARSDGRTLKVRKTTRQSAPGGIMEVVSPVMQGNTREAELKIPIDERIALAKAENRRRYEEAGGGREHVASAVDDVDIDVVIPISGTMYLDHLENCLLSLVRQTFPLPNLGITISCVAHEDIDLLRLGNLCKAYEATLVFTKPRHEAFSRGFALNVGARQGSRKLIALVDSDVYLHKNTLTIAARLCRSAMMVVIPVARKDCGPEHEAWASGRLDNQKFWDVFSEGCPRANAGFGNSVMQRDAFEAIGGHDEGFFGWGGIDTDLYFRCLKYGSVVGLEDLRVPMALHQMHKAPPSKNNQEFTRRNRRLLSSSTSIRRNDDRWGRVLAKP